MRALAGKGLRLHGFGVKTKGSAAMASIGLVPTAWSGACTGGTSVAAVMTAKASGHRFRSQTAWPSPVSGAGIFHATGRSYRTRRVSGG
jgi:hypothetical protein